jgi:hypothetical protein
VVAGLRERPSVSKGEAQKFDMQRFDLRKLNDAEVKEKYHVKISNRFAALENVDNVDTNTDSGNVRENKARCKHHESNTRNEINFYLNIKENLYEKRSK